MDTYKVICRVCRELVGEYNFSMQMIDYSERISYGECFKIVTKIEASSSHKYPQSLCTQCAADMRTAYRFILKAHESDEELRQTLLEGNFEYIELLENDDHHSSQDDITEIKLEEDISDTRKSPEPEESVAKKCSRSRPRKKPGSRVEKKLLRADCSELNLEKQLKGVTKKHKQSTVHLCYACSRTFKDRSALRQHEKIHDKNRDRNYACEKCEKKFFTLSAFQSHLKTHDTDRKALFQCDECEKSFFHKGSLKLHKQIHSGDLLECKVCQKRYVRSIDLEIHLRSHSGNMPYKCQYCDKAFTQIGILNKHIRHHEGYRYKCDICEKEYTHQSTLITHRKEHTGLPLKCSICGKGFVKKSKMRCHIGGVHKVKGFEEIDKLIIQVQTKKKYRGRII